MEPIITIAVAVIASSGIWGLVQFLISRKDKTAEKLDSIWHENAHIPYHRGERCGCTTVLED
jgi:hypothetical protein